MFTAILDDYKKLEGLESSGVEERQEGQYGDTDRHRL